MALVTFFDQSLDLQRFPLGAADPSLQAWDAADEYVLAHLQEVLQRGAQRILLLNDTFGALACALVQQNQSHTIYSLSDSYLAHQGTLHNLAANQLPSAVSLLTSLDALPEAVDVVILKIPKTLAFLEYQLMALRSILTPQTLVVACAKVKELHTSTLNVFSQLIGPTTTSLARKKARLVFPVWEPALNPKLQAACEWPLEGTDFVISNHANVFSRASLDIGGRFLLQHIPRDEVLTQIIDLGCGNGVVGLCAAQANPQAEVVFVDESYMAVASAQANFTRYLTSPARFVVNDCLTGFAANSADLILCNPPFHQQNTISDHIAWQMFKDAKRVLRVGGELRIVGNRHLDYHQKLKRLFGRCTTVASNQKFVILSVNK